MKSDRFDLNVLIGCVLVFTATLAHAAPPQLTDTQQFTVTVPSNMTITAPAPTATITHDETDADQPFGAQQWDVKANARNGATVTFETDQAFTNTSDATYKADANLALAIASSDGPATWTVDTAGDQTDHSIGDGVATVQASSDRAGKASFNLTVTFITGTFSELGEGDYEMTVTGTLAAN